MPEGKKSTADFCCKRCKDQAYQDFIRTERQKELAARVCPTCNGPVNRPANATYCSRSCRDRGAYQPRPRVRRTASCGFCGETFHPKRAQVFCSRRCSTAARWRDGIMVLPPRK